MKLFNGQDTLEMVRTEKQLKVFLEGSQVKTKSFESLEIDAEKIIENPNEVYALELDYALPEKAISLTEAIQKATTRIERLQLAQKLYPLAYYENGFHIPFLHPENIFMGSGTPIVIYFGFLDKINPISFDEGLLLDQYKALVVSTVDTKLTYEDAVRGALSIKDKFSTELESCETLDAINECLAREIVKENEEVNKGKTYVSKIRHLFLLIFSIVAVLALLVAGFFIYNAYVKSMPKQEAIIKAQSDYLLDNYSNTLSDLEHYGPSQLPNSAKYVLATSSVQLSNLTSKQRQEILDNLSVKSDNNTLDYWIYTGRGNFNKALNLAKNLGDNTLTYLAYYNLYESTKLNNSMNGEKKQKLLDEYTKEIDKLGKTLGLTKQKAEHE